MSKLIEFAREFEEKDALELEAISDDISTAFDLYMDRIQEVDKKGVELYKQLEGLHVEREAIEKEYRDRLNGITARIESFAAAKAEVQKQQTSTAVEPKAKPRLVSGSE